MSSSFDLHFEKVQQLKKDVRRVKMMYNSMQHELNIEIKKLQEVCVHDFVAEPNGDYHKPGYYYTCKKCDYFTMYNPKYLHGQNPDTVLNILDN